MTAVHQKIELSYKNQSFLALAHRRSTHAVLTLKERRQISETKFLPEYALSKMSLIDIYWPPGEGIDKRLAQIPQFYN